MLKRLLPLLPLILMLACTPSGPVSPWMLTAVVQTQTASAWTPTPVTPSPTTEPNTGKIATVLNNAMLGADPLAETIEAKFSVIDVRVLYDQTGSLASTLQIQVECEWIYNNGCTAERTFVTLMKAMTRNDKTIGVISENVPSTVQVMQVIALEHMTQRGSILVSWRDFMDYAAGKINGNQLGSRITRNAGP
jgi:hypothetical protein